MAKIVYIFPLFIAVMFAGCSVTIPAEDRTPPGFVFEITQGLPSGMVRITPATDLTNKQLNLRRNTLYQFRFTGNDAGGLSRMNMKVNWPTMFTNLNDDSRIVFITDGELTREMSWTGERSDPKSGKVITGKLNTIIYNTSFDFVSVEWSFFASDFGGASGTTNSVSNYLNVAIVDDAHPVGWVELDP